MFKVESWWPQGAAEQAVSQLPGKTGWAPERLVVGGIVHRCIEITETGVWAAMTKYCTLGHKYQKCVSHHPGGWKPEIILPAWLGSRESPVPGRRLPSVCCTITWQKGYSSGVPFLRAADLSLGLQPHELITSQGSVSQSHHLGC